MFALSFIYMTLRLHEGMRRECVLIPDVSVPSSDTMPGIQEVINNDPPPCQRNEGPVAVAAQVSELAALRIFSQHPP